MMSQVIEQPKFKKAGRPMAIGKVVSNPATGELMVNTGLCENCNYRHFLTRPEAEQFAKQYRRDERSWIVRAIRHLIAIKSI